MLTPEDPKYSRPSAARSEVFEQAQRASRVAAELPCRCTPPREMVRRPEAEHSLDRDRREAPTWPSLGLRAIQPGTTASLEVE